MKKIFLGLMFALSLTFVSGCGSNDRPSNQDVDNDKAEIESAGKDLSAIAKDTHAGVDEKIAACDRFIKIANHIVEKYHENEMTKNDDKIVGVDRVRTSRDNVQAYRDELVKYKADHS